MDGGGGGVCRLSLLDTLGFTLWCEGMTYCIITPGSGTLLYDYFVTGIYLFRSKNDILLLHACVRYGWDVIYYMIISGSII